MYIQHQKIQGFLESHGISVKHIEGRTHLPLNKYIECFVDDTEYTVICKHMDEHANCGKHKVDILALPANTKPFSFKINRQKMMWDGFKIQLLPA